MYAVKSVGFMIYRGFSILTQKSKNTFAHLCIFYDFFMQGMAFTPFEQLYYVEFSRPVQANFWDMMSFVSIDENSQLCACHFDVSLLE